MPESNQLRLSPTQRHALFNHLSALLATLRAMEADLNSDAEDPCKVRGHADEYIDGMVDTVHTIASLVARDRSSAGRVGR